ncbi:hypothetical protein Scep_002252 [Stephania cephalantha]|uniref:Uncharacterized protein n=1 Tax=Stephania cephalantha TaxID=152367 RepID=A0AAP0L9T8_9MAGN
MINRGSLGVGLCASFLFDRMHLTSFWSLCMIISSWVLVVVRFARDANIQKRISQAHY